MSTEPKHKQTRRSNPLEGSSLLSSTPVEPPPSLPTMPTEASVPPVPQQPQVQQSTETVGQPLLYTSKPSAQFMLRPFEQQHDRQTIYIDTYLAGALDALVQLVANGNKTKLVDEMVRDLLKKHERMLRENEELVRLTEEKYHKKHNL